MGYRDKFQQACAVPGSFPPQYVISWKTFVSQILTWIFFL